MTSRARIYFKTKRSIKILAMPEGRKWLSDHGVHPIMMSAESRFWNNVYSGYLIDKKGNILGTTIPPDKQSLYPKYEITKQPICSDVVKREGVVEWNFKYEFK